MSAAKTPFIRQKADTPEEQRQHAAYLMSQVVRAAILLLDEGIIPHGAEVAANVLQLACDRGTACRRKRHSAASNGPARAVAAELATL